MDLINKYVFAVTQHLPESQREDVAKELRATIEDMAADRSGKEHFGDKDVEEVLKELGNPTLLADQYSNTKNYLIGPQWFGMYKSLLFTLLKIIPFVVAAILLISHFISGGWNPVVAILDAIGKGINVAIMVCFWVTVVYVGLERSGTNPCDIQKEWTPDLLPEIPKEPRLSRVEAIVSVVVSVIFIGFLISFRYVPSWYGETTFNTIFNPDLWKIWMPIFIGTLAIEVIYETYKAIKGYWSKPVIAMGVVISFISIVFTIALISTQNIINPSFIESMTAKGFKDAKQFIDWSINATAGVIIVINIFEIINAIRLWFKVNINK